MFISCRIKGFGKNVSQFLFCYNIMHDKCLVFNQFSYKVMSKVNVFAMRILNRILGNINCTFIVTKYNHMSLFYAIIFKHFFHPHQLCATTSYLYILSLWSRKWDGTLLLIIVLYNQVISKINASTISVHSIIYITCLINIIIACQMHIWISNTKSQILQCH